MEFFDDFVGADLLPTCHCRQQPAHVMVMVNVDLYSAIITKVSNALYSVLDARNGYIRNVVV